MKILQVVHGFPPEIFGGTEVYTSQLCEQLNKRHKVTVFCRSQIPRAKEYALQRKSINGIEIFSINNTFRNYLSFADTYRNPTIASRFESVLEETLPDIVHLHHLLYLSTEVIEVIKKKRIPTVFTLHDYWLICPQGQLFKKNWTICQDKVGLHCRDCIIYQLSIRKNISHVYNFFRHGTPERFFQFAKNSYLEFAKVFLLNPVKVEKELKARQEFIRQLCEKIDIFIAPSKFIKEKFITFGIPEPKIKHIPYGFDYAKFCNCPKSPSIKLRFGFIGNLMPAKAPHVLIQAFNKIEDKDAELRIYGKALSYKSSLNGYTHQLQRLAKNENIKFMGGFDHSDITSVFKEIDVLVVPSIWQENSPLVIQEAFLSGTPVIATDIGGIGELIQDGINGMLFAPGSVEDLCEKISSVVVKRTLLERFQKNIKLPLSIQDNSEEIEGIYEGLLSSTQTS